MLAVVVSASAEVRKKHHKHKHHGHHKKALVKKDDPAPPAAPAVAPQSTETQILEKMKKLEGEIDKKQEVLPAEVTQTTERLDVNGPLPADFNQLFAQAAAKATGVQASSIQVVENNIITSKDGAIIVEIVFKGPAKAVHAVKLQAADFASPLAQGVLHPYLVAKEGVEDVSVLPGVDTGIDVNTEMPYGELEPFGREDTASELTEDSIKESDGMVDQMEKAEVAEEKRSVFRALTRLRGAAITSFDGVARSQTGNIDEYNKVHKWRKTHPLQHLAAEENNVSKWAFPSTSD